MSAFFIPLTQNKAKNDKPMLIIFFIYMAKYYLPHVIQTPNPNQPAFQSVDHLPSYRLYHSISPDVNHV